MRQPGSESGRAWGVIKSPWFWITSVIGGPMVLLLGATVSGVVMGLVAYAPLILAGSDRRIEDTIWYTGGHGGDTLFAACFFVGMVLSAAMILTRWAQRAFTHIRMDKDAFVVWTLTGRKTLAWNDVVRAFVTRMPGADGERALHVWTQWRDVALPIDRIVDAPTDSLQNEEFEIFLQEFRGHLEAHGMALEEDVPSSALTDAAWPLRYGAFWLHRRVLARRWHRLRGDAPVTDHRNALPSMHLAWLFRPAPMAAWGTVLGTLIFVRWGTEAQLAPSILAGAGLLMALFVPLWNTLKEKLATSQNAGALTPEMLVGKGEAPEPLPKLLLPARGCYVDLEQGRIGRPDGRTFEIAEIGSVEYGPARQTSDQPRTGVIRQQAWHLALGLRQNPSQMREIYHNASVDIVRHGDIDAGYAVFNWVTARAIAQKAEASLILAQGRVGPKMVGRPLWQVLSKDAAQYDPEPLETDLDARRGVRIRSTPERFEAWGPLVRQPEMCAAPPIWKAVAVLGLLALLPTGFVAAGLIAGVLLAGLVHDLLTQVHFAHPGFAMDEDGVWVRGQCIGWDALEQSTLMPVAPGPLLFAGQRSVLIVGHMGGTYTERAWLGCAAYQWIQQRFASQPL